MFIRAVIKKDKNKSKSYTYYRLTHSYRVGNKTRQVVVLNLGKLEGLSEVNRKLLEIRIEEIYSANKSLFSVGQFAAIEDLAQAFALKIAKDKIFSSSKSKSIAEDIKQDYQNVDLQTIEQLESKSIGGEWLVKQTFTKLGIPAMLAAIGFNEKQITDAQLLLTGKLLHPSSELEAERWLNESSAAANSMMITAI